LLKRTEVNVTELFTEAESNELLRLLRKVAANGGYWPTEDTLQAAHGCQSAWATELVITRRRFRPVQILLTVYEGGADAFKRLWHIPGGYNRWSETIRETCSRIAEREIGADVTPRRVITTRKWKEGEHPYGRPLSVYLDCTRNGNVTETATRRFFTKRELPPNMVEPHRQFIEDHL
jgi:ADP-ribose pyrophosphatase YjhB (NUDIX family)